MSAPWNPTMRPGPVQGDLFTIPPIDLVPTRRAVKRDGEIPIRDGATFHAINPQVMRVLVQLARLMKAHGLPHWGINAAFEVARWQAAMQTKGDIYKLNNNYAPWYSREIMFLHPELEGFFITRASKTDPDFHTREVRG